MPSCSKPPTSSRTAIRKVIRSSQMGSRSARSTTLPSTETSSVSDPISSSRSAAISSKRRTVRCSAMASRSCTAGSSAWYPGRGNSSRTPCDSKSAIRDSDTQGERQARARVRSPIRPLPIGSAPQPWPSRVAQAEPGAPAGPPADTDVDHSAIRVERHALHPARLEVLPFVPDPQVGAQEVERPRRELACAFTRGGELALVPDVATPDRSPRCVVGEVRVQIAIRRQLPRRLRLVREDQVRLHDPVAAGKIVTNRSGAHTEREAGVAEWLLHSDRALTERRRMPANDLAVAAPRDERVLARSAGDLELRAVGGRDGCERVALLVQGDTEGCEGGDGDEQRAAGMQDVLLRVSSGCSVIHLDGAGPYVDVKRSADRWLCKHLAGRIGPAGADSSLSPGGRAFQRSASSRSLLPHRARHGRTK